MNVILLIGGNSGNRLELLRGAIAGIEREIGSVIRYSSVYETEPWGFEAEMSFYNMALLVQTELLPEDVLHKALNLERILGRVRSGAVGYQSRPMDIDIILCDDLVIETPQLLVPHPRMCERRFVLEPICQIAPDYMHPVEKLPMSTLLTNCKDELKVKKVGEIFGLKE